MRCCVDSAEFPPSHGKFFLSVLFLKVPAQAVLKLFEWQHIWKHKQCNY